MPAAHGYYSKHSRKISSSQMSLPEQLQNAASDNASRSMTFLPATTYLEPPNDPLELNDSVLSPDAFYRQYHNQYAQSVGAPIRQGALKTTDLDAAGLQENGRSTPTMDDRHTESRFGVSTNGQELISSHLASPGLRGRRSSVKNLVEQINSTSTEVFPPMPKNAMSNAGSRDVSPALSFKAQFQQLNPPRQSFSHHNTHTIPQYNPNGGSSTKENGLPRFASDSKSAVQETRANTRRPLFGEVVSDASRHPAAGYGIQPFRKRGGSEGSPLPSPSYVMRTDPEVTPRNNYETVTTSDASFVLSPAVYTATNNQSHHRRANSESPLTPTGNLNEMVPPTSSYSSNHSRTQGSSSRIPVSIRRGSVNADPDGRSTATAISSTSNLNLSSADQKRSGPVRRPLSPPQIQSPGQRGKKSTATQGPKSPSLRANIIVPPPKISPPLRSSRPRLPISSASTTTSRAKMAERFSALQKLNEEKRQAARKAARPPELSDIDLKARRLRITQALSRSLEGPDLKGNDQQKRHDFSKSRTVSPAPSDRSRSTELSEDRSVVPAVVVDDIAIPENTSDNYAPFEGGQRQERAFSHNALNAMQGSTRTLSPEADSPTIRPANFHYLKQPTPLQTNIHHINRSYEPSSAITEGTMIDAEPQDDFQDNSQDSSILNQIKHERSQHPVRDSAYETFSDRGDQESVQLIFRDTTYLDDDEAVRKGYRPAPPFPNSVPQEHGTNYEQRDSTTPSGAGLQENDSAFARFSDDVGQVSLEDESFPFSQYNRLNRGSPDASARSTMASDAYTIVNIVLQQHSTSGIVDQQFVDDVYQRILEDSSFTDENSLSADRIEQICLQEIQDREESWYKPASDGESLPEQPQRLQDDAKTPTKKTSRGVNGQQDKNDWLLSQAEDPKLAPPPFLKGHRYKSSLDSVEDWANTSPSVSDWIRFAADDETQKMAGQRPIVPADLPQDIAIAVQKRPYDNKQLSDDGAQDVEEDPEMYSAPAPRQPAHSPPPLPVSKAPSIEDTSFGSAIIQRPQIPRRVTSISQIGRYSPRGRQSPSASAPVLGKVSIEEVISPEQRRLKQRRNVIKELVDTEFSYEKDLRVLCDIYKQTASVALGEDDIRTLFGNVEQVQIFSKDFLMLLKSLAKPTYAMERPDRKKDKNMDKADATIRPQSSSSTLASTKASDDLPTVEKDRETRIGQAFEASLVDMEKVYTEYIKNRHAANLRLEAIQKSDGAREWLKECKDNSSDITNAWNLDALLVKPVQRITKYPLLLKELVDSTSEDHPDLLFLRRALHEMTEVNIRINDVKKHAELVDQVLNRKRKDSDVRAGLSKAFGRRAEKLKQHVGITELYEDAKYNEIKIHYDNNIVQLMVVGNDCSSYGRSITKWVNKMVEIAAAAEAWVDVGHSNHQEAESRLRQFAMVVRGISTIALPDHLEQLNTKVLTPMQHAVDAMTKFKTDPKGLLQKREKRMIDYAQIKSKKDKGEKIDKKMIERMEQSEALNVEAKQRMRKLVTATAKLVQACQANLVQMQVTWQGMVRQKLSAAMGVSLEHLDVDDIRKDWQIDFDYQEASALSLGICNGSLLAEAVNMVNFQASATTLNGEDSPRQASFTSASKRSISLASENSYPPIPEYDPRTSGTYGHQYHEHSIPYANPRGRAQSATSTKYQRTPDLSHAGSANEGFPNYGRYDSGSAAPRLSVETPSPLIGALQPEPSSRRPVSSSTFFSASGTPPPPHHQSTGSSVFSSAMPMSDSPVVERFSEPSALADPDVLFTAASVYEFNIDRSRREAGFPYLTYVTGEIFDVIGERGELWLAKNQDDPNKQIGWIWNKHFAKLAE